MVSLTAVAAGVAVLRLDGVLRRLLGGGLEDREAVKAIGHIVDAPPRFGVGWLLLGFALVSSTAAVFFGGGALDGQSIYSFEGFNGEANGLTFDPPLELPGATGFVTTLGTRWMLGARYDFQ